MSDVVHVVVDGGGTGIWDVLGNGAITTLLAAAVALVVSRAGRSREDLKDWRDTRHAKYSTVLAETDNALDAFRETRVRIQLVGEEVAIEPGRAEEMTQIASRLEVHAREIRLMGYPFIHMTAQAVASIAGGFATWMIDGELVEADAPPIWTLSWLQRQEDVFGIYVRQLENAMLKQLGIRFPRTMKGYFGALWKYYGAGYLRRLGLRKRQT